MIHKALFTLLMLISIILLASCSPAQTTSTPVPNMPNPAAVYCEQHSGKLEIVTSADGSQSGLCLFPDGSTCDEWAFFRGECKPGDSLAMSGLAVSPTPRPASPTAVSVSTATSAPAPTSLPPLAIDETWATYTNGKYGFSVRYPADWKLNEITGSVNTMSGHAVHLLHPTDPTVRLIIAFKRVGEDQLITPTGIGSGELITRGEVSLLGQQLERMVLVDLGKDMAVYYGWPRPATTGGDLVFWLALDCACSAGDPAVNGLTRETEQIADAVVGSITLK